MNGLLDGGHIAAETSAASAARMNAKRRTVNQPPTKIHQLNDQVVNRQITSAEMSTMRVAEVTQPASGIDFGDAISTTITISITNVNRTHLHGRSTNEQSLMEEPAITIISPTGNRALRLALPAILEALKIDDNISDNMPTSPIAIRKNAVLITNEEQMKKYQGKKIRKKVLELSDNEIDQSVLDEQFPSFTITA